MKAFALTDSDKLTMLSHLIFSNNGFDPFCEDIGTLWLLHYQLVTTHVASIYDLTFTEFQRERREFDKEQLLGFIHRKCNVLEQKNVYNENTVKKDISVMLQTYVPPTNLKQLEHCLSDLALLFLLTMAGIVLLKLIRHLFPMR